MPPDPEPAPMVRRGPRPRLTMTAEPAAIYAIGDVHGHLHLLEGLEAQILADSATIEGEKWLVMLGDYVDRGPHSRQVIEHLLAPPPTGFQRFCLCGNHEETMLDFLAEPDETSSWLAFGGIETLASYGVDLTRLDLPMAEQRRVLMAAIPAEHRAFMAGLPVLLRTPNYVFVHAGLRPRVPLEAQTERDLLWIRDSYRESFAEFGRIVVHGHTPRTEPLVTPSRIAIDTGAFASGHLTAVRLLPGAAPKILQT